MEAAPGRICIVGDWPLAEGFERDIFDRSLMREGIHASEVTKIALLSQRPYAGDMHRANAEAVTAGKFAAAAAIRTARPNVILSLGDTCTEWLTGCSGIDKWQASVLTSAEFACKVIPCYSSDRIRADLSLQLWLGICARKLRSEAASPLLVRRPHVFLLNPTIEQTIAELQRICRLDQPISIDIETGRGQINTVGFATGPDWAMAINTLPDRLGSDAFHELWRSIANVIQSDQPKILQNFIYEQLYFSRYGIRLTAVAHCTMICQKFLWPEFKMGLDAVCRMYSQMAYWKEDGKSWNNIRDWERHYEYNCKDTTGTYEGYLGQRADLRERGLSELYDSYIARLFPAVAEMCSNGLPVSVEKLAALKASVLRDYDAEISALRALPGAESLNARSPGQVKKFLQAAPRSYKIPEKYDSATKSHKESTDEKSLKKLRMKYPDDAALTHLLKLAKLGKAHSSYLSFGYDADNRMRYSLTAGGTETMRWSGHCDPWDNGVNPQTIPGGSKGINIKQIFEASPGYTFLQCDLRQAETRFVAYDAADANLIRDLEDCTVDIHSNVATEICKALGKDPAQEKRDKQNWKYRWRQLGKKSGHGSNYDMGIATFIDSCISDMDLVLSKAEAGKILGAYHTLYPGIRRWHANLQQELCQTRQLKTPWGWTRHFYGRMNDDTFKEGYAFRPQATIPYVINWLMLHLCELRTQRVFDFRLLLQGHDSILLEVPMPFVRPIAEACLRTEPWQQGFDLAGGRLIIPTEIELGTNYGELKKYEQAST